MFSSNNCTTSNDPINPYFNNKTTFLNPNKNTNYVNIIPSNPKQEDNLISPLNVQPPTTTTPLPFSGFSTSPFEIDQNEDQFLLHQNHFVNVSPYNYSQPMIMMELSANNTDHQNINNIVATTPPPPPPSLPQVVREPNNKTLVDSSSKMKKKINLTDQENIPRKRSTGKRDRHSKINTARGLRDRRMRLSLEVARKFFGLQDMLGFDKASKTVEWLLTQSKSEIKKLGGELNYRSSCTKSASSTNNSESEVVSCNLDEVAINIEQQEQQQQQQQQQHSSTINGSSCKPLLATTKRKKRQSRKIVINPLAKESRDKARERARERAKEKKKSRSIKSSLATLVVDHHHHHDHVSSKPFDHDHQDQEITNNHDHLRLPSCWSPFHHQTREDSGLSTQTQSNINNSSSLQVLPPQEVEETINVNVDDHSFVNMEKYWSPSALIFNSLHNNEISQHEQNFADFPILWQNMDP